MLRLFAWVLASGAVLGLFVFLIARGWRVEATLKATTRAPVISLAAGLSLAGLSASVAAILDGPGVIAVHLRARELWRRPIERVSVDTMFAWLDELLSKKDAPTKPGLGARLSARIMEWLLPRTDISGLPGFGIRLLTGLRAVTLGGTVTCGFADPALAGTTAAWLYPLAGVLAPLGALDVSFDWSGKNRLDADVQVSCRLSPARAMLESLRFARRHVHPLRKAPLRSSVPSTLQT